MSTHPTAHCSVLHYTASHCQGNEKSFPGLKFATWLYKASVKFKCQQSGMEKVNIMGSVPRYSQNLFQNPYTGSWSPQGPLELRALHIDYSRRDSGTFQSYLWNIFINTGKREGFLHSSHTPTLPTTHHNHHHPPPAGMEPGTRQNNHCSTIKDGAVALAIYY